MPHHAALTGDTGQFKIIHSGGVVRLPDWAETGLRRLRGCGWVAVGAAVLAAVLHGLGELREPAGALMLAAAQVAGVIAGGCMMVAWGAQLVLRHQVSGFRSLSQRLREGLDAEWQRGWASGAEARAKVMDLPRREL